MLWLAVGEGALMAILWVAYLTFSGRQPNQPLRRYKAAFYLMFFVLTLVLNKTIVSFLAISGAHQRERFILIAMGLFLLLSLVATIILAVRAAPVPDTDR